VSEKRFEEEIRAIKERNLRVEADKAWETSMSRRLILGAATYLVALYFLILIEVPNPVLAAAVPAAAFLLQQYSMPFIKRLWVQKFYRKQGKQE
jgi:hypothetical protein